MKKISVVIIARNEEKMIEECLKSVSWADEIIVVDDSSTDKTAELAKKYTSHVYTHKSVGYVEPVRNFALQKATGDWVLLLDTDERISKELASHIQEVIGKGEDITAYILPRKNIIFGKWIQHTGWWPDYNIRLFKKGSVTWSNAIHSVPEVEGITEKFDAREEYAITHYNYVSVSQYLEKMLRYTSIESEQYKEKINISDFISHPAQEFMGRFFMAQGYKDGVHGLVLSALQAFSVFLVRVKVWELNKYEAQGDKNLLKTVQKENKKIKKEVAYWFSNELLKT